jgi:hypothetical protein
MAVKYSDRDCPRCKDNKMAYTGIRIETGNPLRLMICNKCLYRDFEPIFVLVKEIYGYSWMSDKMRKPHPQSCN